MVKETAITEAGAAVRTIEFVGVQNLVPTFCAFDTAIDQLEHQMFPSLALERRSPKRFCRKIGRTDDESQGEV
jgi:hypothetical protein